MWLGTTLGLCRTICACLEVVRCVSVSKRRVVRDAVASELPSALRLLTISIPASQRTTGSKSQPGRVAVFIIQTAPPYMPFAPSDTGRHQHIIISEMD